MITNLLCKIEITLSLLSYCIENKKSAGFWGKNCHLIVGLAHIKAIRYLFVYYQTWFGNILGHNSNYYKLTISNTVLDIT